MTADIVDSASSIDPDQPKHDEQANPVRHFSPPVYFLFRESLLYTCIPLRRNVTVHYAESIMLVCSWNGSCACNISQYKSVLTTEG